MGEVIVVLHCVILSAQPPAQSTTEAVPCDHTIWPFTGSFFFWSLTVYWIERGKQIKVVTTVLLEVFGGFIFLPSCLPTPAWIYLCFSPLKQLHLP